MKKQKAFTLIELLVVIVIIGILSGFVIVSLSQGVAAAQDAKKKSDLAAVQRALLIYQVANNSYPTEESECSIGNDCLSLEEALVPIYLQEMPDIPVDADYTYISNGSTFTIKTTLSSDNVYSYTPEQGWTETPSSPFVGWHKRKLISISNPGSSLSDYQVKLEIAYDSDMQPDFDDLRFATSDNIVLNYWLESKTDSSSAKVWVKVLNIPSGSSSFYMYYNNSEASSASNGENTFIFFDDFNSGTIDSGKWISACLGNNSGGSVSVSGGELVVTARSSCYASCKTVCYVRSTNTFDIRSGYAIQYYAKQYESSGEGSWWKGGFFLSDASTPPYDPANYPSIASSIMVTQSLVTYPSNPPSLCVADRLSNAGSEACDDQRLYYGSNFPGNHIFTVGINETAVNIFADATQLVNNATHRQSSFYNKYLYFLRGADQSIYATQRFDNVLVRKYVFSEPSSFFGNEQSI